MLVFFCQNRNFPMNSVCCFSRGARRTGGCSVKVASLLALILKSPKKKEENEENWFTVKEIVLKFIKIAFFAFVINVFFLILSEEI